MRESKVIEYSSNDIDFKVEFTMLKPSQSLKFLIYVAKIIGGSSGKVIGAFNGNAGKMEDLLNFKENDLSLEKLGDALFGIMERFEDDEVVDKLNLLLGSCKTNGEKLYVDHMIFSNGNIDLIFKIAKEALGVNYSRFLGGNSGLFSKITKSLSILKNTKNSQAKEM